MSVIEQSLQQEFGLLPADALYAKGLRDQYENPKRKNHQIGIDFIPSSLMTEQERTEVLEITQYEEIKGNDFYVQQAQNMHLILHPMDAGLGSSVKRDSYLQNLNGIIDRGNVTGLGSKSTDLYFPIVNETTSYENIAAIKLRRIAQESKQYGGVTIAPIVNGDSLAAMDNLYNQNNGESSYTDYLHKHNVVRTSWHIQGDLPTVDVSTTEFTQEHTAPGGHGQAGVMILHDIMHNSEDNTQRIHAIFNGDGPNNFVTPEMVSFTAEQAGIVMLTTTRMPCDVKGGIIGGELHENGHMTPQILELAQAKAVGQQELFMNLGLKTSDLPEDMQEQHHEGQQYFNTNIALMNANVLKPFLHKLKEQVGEDRFAQLLTPELILNRKEKHGKQYDQLEGALGSLILRLNQLVQTDNEVAELWEEVSEGKSFLKILNTSPQDRDETFLPNKFPIDYVMQASSDHFQLDQDSWLVRNTHVGHVPRFEGDLVKNGTYYSDVQNCLDAFGYLHMLDLEELHLEGPVQFANATLKGKVHIYNESNEVVDFNAPHLKSLFCSNDGPVKLNNVHVQIKADKTIEISYY